jgi:hypothetical protein
MVASRIARGLGCEVSDHSHAGRKEWSPAARGRSRMEKMDIDELLSQVFVGTFLPNPPHSPKLV